MSVLLSSESDSVREQIDDSGMTLRHRIRTAMDSVRLSWSSTNMMDKLRAINPFGSRAAKIGTASFANNYFIMTIGWCLFCLTVIADVYALVSLRRIPARKRHSLIQSPVDTTGNGRGVTCLFSVCAAILVTNGHCNR